MNLDYIEQRLRAYILPRVPETSSQIEALENAIQAQAEYEGSAGLDALPGMWPAFRMTVFP